MALSRQEIYINYHECLNAVTEILRTEYSWTNNYDLSLSDFAQTVVGNTRIVELLQEKPFEIQDFSIVIKECIEGSRQELIPDLRKRQFSPIFESTQQLIETPEGDITRAHTENALEILQQKLSEAKFAQLTRIIEQNQRSVPIWISHLDSVAEVERKLDLVAQFFTDNQIPDIKTFTTKGQLSDEDIISCYKCVYLRIENHFPENFLKHDGLHRAAVLVQFLVDVILTTSPREILENHDIGLFSEHNLQNVARLFNYSLNRVLRNAYPELIVPWINSRIPNNYWESSPNRIEAVRWLVEQHLGLDIENLQVSQISRSSFSKTGLSFLYNTYYNSVSKALMEAYPFLHRWEVGSVPFDFWTDVNAARAIRWMIKKKEWKDSGLAVLVKQKQFTKNTFTEFGLATLFDKKFNKNMFQAINCAFPGKYKPWEIGKVSTSYWKKPENLFQAAEWIASQEGISADQIIQAIRQQKISLATIKKYSIGSALKNQSRGYLANLFWPALNKERRYHNDELKLIRKLNHLINEHRQPRTIVQILQHGFFFGLYRQLTRPQTRHLERMKSRIQRRQKSLTD